MLRKPVPLPARPNVLYIDAPWQFDNVRTGGTMSSGSAAQYPVLKLPDLIALALTIGFDILADNAVVASWTTTAMKPEGMKFLDSFGVTYKTSFYWIKDYGGDRLGMGAWNRGGVEELLIGVRGNVKAWRMQRPSWVRHRVLTHSQKPRIFRSLIEQGTDSMPFPRRVELFARRRARGWAATGLEYDGRDIREVIQSWPRK